MSGRLPDNTGEQHSTFIIYVLFQPSVRLIEKVDQQSQLKNCFFPTKALKILTNPTNQKELIVIEHNPRVPDNYHSPQLAVTV